MQAIAFKGHDRIHHVFQQARTSDIAILSYMTHQNNGHIAGLCFLHKPECTLANLRYRTWSRLDRFIGNRLHTVDDHQGG